MTRSIRIPDSAECGQSTQPKQCVGYRDDSSARLRANDWMNALTPRTDGAAGYSMIPTRMSLRSSSARCSGVASYVPRWMVWSENPIPAVL